MNEIRYSPKNSALLLIDFLNDFLAEDGKLAPELRPMILELDLLNTYQTLLAGARDRGLKIFYVPHGVDEHSFDDVPSIHPRTQRGLDERIAWIGEYGGGFYPPLAPQPEDIVVSRHRQYDGFFRTNLEEKLREHGVEKVVLAGHTTHTCVEGTGRHALEAGFHVTFLTDAVAEFSEPPHRFALEYSFPSFGHATLTVEEFLRRVEVR